MRINLSHLRTYVIMLMTCLQPSFLQAATAPVVGTTTFTGLFGGQGAIIGPGTSPLTASDVGGSGWDFTIAAASSTLVISVNGSGNDAGDANDFCIRTTTNNASISFGSTTVKSNDASKFGLQSVFIKLNITAGTSADITVTGYRSGSPVPGATFTRTALSSGGWNQFNVAAISQFQNVDQFVITQAASSSSTINFIVVDDITIATAAPLPLTLTSFSGQRDNNKVRLQWSTAAEQNTAQFEVQRATNGADFSGVGQVQAAGNSTQTLHYTYSDELPALSSPAWFYRLKLADLDGRFTYSPVLRISAPATGLSFSAYPNPFRQQVVITAEAAEAGKAQLTIRDMGGKLLLRQDLGLQKGTSSFSLPPTTQLGKGIYLLNIATSQGQQTLRLVKNE